PVVVEQPQAPGGRLADLLPERFGFGALVAHHKPAMGHKRFDQVAQMGFVREAGAAFPLKDTALAHADQLAKLKLSQAGAGAQLQQALAQLIDPWLILALRLHNPSLSKTAQNSLGWQG